MCGLAGFIRSAPRAAAPADRGADGDVRRLERMAAALAHRGPDGSGLWLSPDRRVGLCHRRLAIVDLSERAAQPMQDDGLCVAFNGEIYNHMDLRRELRQAGASFVTDHSDTEVLLHGYRCWGLRGLLDRLRGMYAFALWDGPRGRLTLARDPLGIKPLYFRRGEGETVFASEIKALLADDGRAAMDAGALEHYLTFLVTPAPLTLFDGIGKLPPGHVIEVEADGRQTCWRHWHPSAAAVDGDPETLVRRHLDDSVGAHLMADVPVGVFLSGGVDSTAIATLAARRHADLRAFSVGFSDYPQANEVDQAGAVAAALGIPAHHVLIDASDMQAALPAIVEAQDEPLADWVCIPLYFVAGLARRHGVKAVLVGEGADELFCGYAGYLAHLRFQRRYAGRLRALPGMARGGLARLAEVLAPVWGTAETYADLLRRVAEGGDVFWGGAIGFLTRERRRLLLGEPSPAPAELVRGLFDEAGALLPGADELTRMIWLELRQRLSELLLMRVDKMTMAHGLEARVPFLDRDLVELALSLPEPLKTAGGRPKALLKSALGGIVPDEVLDRPKLGFGAPMAQWLRGDFGLRAREWVLDSPLLSRPPFRRRQVERLFAQHRDGGRDRSVQLWVLINLALWHGRWIEGGAA